MDLYSIWPYFLCMAVIVIASTFPKTIHFLDPASSYSTELRFATLDGLRGFLAMGVVMTHTQMHQGFLRTHLNVIPPSTFYTLLGQVGVSFFFMLTGFLFWGKLIDEHGRPHWGKLFIGRLFRIGPLYAAAFLVALAACFTSAHYQMQESASAVFIEIVRWCGLGLFGQPDIDKQSIGDLLGVVWTLRFEWLFYFSLPFLAIPFRINPGLRRFIAPALRHVAVLLPIVIILISAIDAQRFVSLLAQQFAYGMLAAGMIRTLKIPNLNNQLGSLIVTLLMILLFVEYPTAYGLIQNLLMGTVFLLFCTGINCFGLLDTKAARRLGHISYSIYLLQGLVLTAIFSLPAVQYFSAENSLNSWIVNLAGLFLLVLLSVAAYYFIERKGIEIGRIVANKLCGRKVKHPPAMDPAFERMARTKQLLQETDA